MSDERVLQSLDQPTGEATTVTQVPLPDDGQAFTERVENGCEPGRLGHRPGALVDQDDTAQHAVQRSTLSNRSRKSTQLAKALLVPVDRGDRHGQ